MTQFRRRTSTLILVASLALYLGCGGKTDTGSASGVVEKIDRAGSQITISHGDIPGMMKAMTMSFGVSDPELLEDVKDGDEIDFSVRYAEGKYTVTAIERR